MIKMQVIGNLGKDCMVNTVGGKSVINFTVAQTDRFRDSSGANQEKTTWVECAYWTDRTAVAQYLTKGKQVFVEGWPEARAFQRNDGTPGASLTLRVRELRLLGGKADQPAASQSTMAENTMQSKSDIPAPSEITETSDDLPF